MTNTLADAAYQVHKAELFNVFGHGYFKILSEGMPFFAYRPETPEGKEPEWHVMTSSTTVEIFTTAELADLEVVAPYPLDALYVLQHSADDPPETLEARHDCPVVCPGCFTHMSDGAGGNLYCAHETCKHYKKRFKRPKVTLTRIPD